MSSPSLRLVVRLVLLAVGTVVIQEAAVSQISIFGVSADITPLMVMSVGLLAGSLTGAVMGFAIGLLVDTVLVQTLGVTSLLYIAIGYWAGRLRELRDPAHGLVPLAAGAAATAVAGIGMTLIQFLLGVDAPVSLLLFQQIFITILVNTLISLPVYAVVRRIIHPALPDDPRRRRRRAYTTGGLSPLQSPSKRLGPAQPRWWRMTIPPEDRRPPMTPQLALRVAVVGSFALGLFAIIFFRLWFLQVLSGDQYVQAATVNRVRKIDVAAPRGEILDASGAALVDSVKTLAVQISPEDLPVPVTLDKLDTLEHPPKADAIVYNRLAHVLGMSTKRTRCRLHMPTPNVFRLSPVACAVAQQVTLQSYADVTVARARW